MFKWLRSLFSRIKGDDIPEWEFSEDSEEALDRKRLNLNDPEQMERYVRACCDQMRESTEEIDKSSMEYRIVTDHLRDIEELDQLQDDDKRALQTCANAILELQQDEKDTRTRVGNMDDLSFYKMERYESEMPQALENLIKNEEYKALVKTDLQNLEGEKMSYKFRVRELRNKERFTRELTIVILFSTVMLLGILSFLQYLFGFEVQLSLVLVGALGALALTIDYVQFSGARQARQLYEKKLNVAISVQNTVKIRYINAASVVDYTYAKFDINSSRELGYLWDRYVVEKREREKLKNANFLLDKQQRELLNFLKRIQIRYPDVWASQAGALVDPREMVEIRHDLIARRQSLRKRIEYNENNRSWAAAEIKDLVDDYPAQAKIILSIVDQYD